MDLYEAAVVVGRFQQDFLETVEGFEDAEVGGVKLLAILVDVLGQTDDDVEVGSYDGGER